MLSAASTHLLSVLQQHENSSAAILVPRLHRFELAKEPGRSCHMVFPTVAQHVCQVADSCSACSLRKPLLLPADWQDELKAYVAQHPSTRLLDSFEAIKVLGNRDRMLRALDGGLRLKAPGSAGGQELMCRVPVQVTIDTGGWSGGG